MAGPGRRLGLGGAQFGMPYGTTNTLPPPDKRELGRILERAAEAGIGFVDTAPAYGDSEERIGLAIGSDGRFRLGTKTVVLPDGPSRDRGGAIRDGIRRSLDRLRRNRLDLLTLHHADALSGPDWPEIVQALQAAKADGLVGRIGASLYDPSELDVVVPRLAPEVVQVPVNPLDRRFLEPACLDRLRRHGIVLHARSVFLQGLLLADAESIPAFARCHRALVEWRAWLKAHRLSPRAACLGYVLAQPAIELAIVGVAGDSDLAGLIEALPAARTADVDFRASATDLIDPRRWPARGRP